LEKKRKENGKITKISTKMPELEKHSKSHQKTQIFDKHLNAEKAIRKKIKFWKRIF